MWLVNTTPVFGVDFGTASVGAVTVTITRADGTVLVADAATTDNTDGTYQYQLDLADNTRPDLLRLDWKVSATSEVVALYEEVTENLLFTIDQARNKTITGQQKPLALDTAYPDADIARARLEVADWFEAVTARAWMRRFARVELQGSGRSVLGLTDGTARTVDGAQAGGPGRFRDIGSLIAVYMDTVLVTTPIRIDGSSLILDTGVWTGDVVVEYTYGRNPVPLEATDAALRLAVRLLVPSDVPSYAQSFSSADGNIVYPPGGFVYPSQTHAFLKRNMPVFVA